MTLSLAQIAADLAAISGLGDDHLPAIERILAPVITGVTRDILRSRPATPLPIRTLDGPIYRDEADPEIGHVPLPDDFLALATFRMEGWTCDVSRLILPGDPEYPLRSSPWPEISGSPRAPRCYLITTPTGDALEYRRADPEARCLSAVYHPAPALRRGHIDIPQEIYHTILETLKPLYYVPDTDLR